MRKLSGINNYIVTGLSIALVLFQIYTAGFGVFPDVVQRSVHLFFVLTLCFMLRPATKKAPKDKVPFYDLLLAVIAGCSTVYILFNYQKILWDPMQWVDPFDMIFAGCLVVLILEASRRTVGWTFPIMAIVLMLYACFGEYFPGIWGHENFTVSSILQNLYHSTSGIWGTMVGISATMLAMFGIFGAVLSATGGSQTFIKLGQILTGRSIGGSGKVTLIASGLFGMISGSAMANVVATGTFTIPLMKKEKFSDEWAAAVSAVGSTGGQIMPPIMGAGAFIMAQLIGVSYLDIAKAAIFPAILYYLGAFVAVHYTAKKSGIVGSPTKEKVSLQESIIIFVPLLVFVIYLIRGYSVTVAAFYSTFAGFITCAIVYFVTSKNLPGTLKQTGKLAHKVSMTGASSILDMASLLAGAQISITLISITGFGVKLSDIIVSVGQNNLFLCLVLSMLVCIILGMGLPTTAAYVLAAAILAPALTTLGLNVFIAHLFVFYFATLATITPPVCAAVFLSAGIAGANWVKTGFLSVLIALPAFVVPYTFAYNQAILLRGGDVLTILIAVITAVVGVYILGVAVAGYINKPLHILYRLALLVGGILLLIPNVLVSLIGLVVCAVILFINYRQGGALAKGGVQ